MAIDRRDYNIPIGKGTHLKGARIRLNTRFRIIFK